MDRSKDATSATRRVKVNISSDAEQDLVDGFSFYESQLKGLGDYFRSAIIADIESLTFYAGIHERSFGLHRMLSRRFPFLIYYQVRDDMATVVAVLDARRSPSWIQERLEG